jgi:hypothetical protein
MLNDCLQPSLHTAQKANLSLLLVSLWLILVVKRLNLPELKLRLIGHRCMHFEANISATPMPLIKQNKNIRKVKKNLVSFV